MVKLIVLAFYALVAGVLAEPPSSYLPPQARGSPSSFYGVPSSSYGAPNGDFRSNENGKASSFHSLRSGSQSFSYNSLHENQFGDSQKKSFGLGKSFSGDGFGGVPSQRYGSPGQLYKAPSRNGFSFRNGNSNGNGFGLPQQYGVPSFGNGFGASSSGFGISQQYGAPNFGVSQQFGAPSFSAKSSSHRFGSSGTKFGNGNGYAFPSSFYGAPYSKMNDDLSEPANYEYNYEVQAAEESGAEFGHQESREDEAARGVYHVLLPDGRTQIVEYEADEEGFRPVIRYEEPSGYPAAGVPQGPY